MMIKTHTPKVEGVIRLSCDSPETPWIIFPTPHLRSLWLRHKGANFNYIQTWNDAQGWGLEACNTTTWAGNNPNFRKADSE